MNGGKSDKEKNERSKKRKRVDPNTGEPSEAPDAIPYATYQDRKRVDPKTGKPSTASDAITYSTYKRRKRVDPKTGEPSTASDAIPNSTYLHRKRVDPKTGKPSTASDAIPYATYQKRKRVDPKTGEPSTASDAILYATYQKRKRVEKKKRKRQDDSSISLPPKKKKNTKNQGVLNDLNENQIILTQSRKRKKREENLQDTGQNNPKRKKRRLEHDLNENQKSVEQQPIPMDQKVPEMVPVKKEPGIVLEAQPLSIVKLDIEKFKKIAKVLGANSDDSSTDCTYLTECFLNYLRTGVEPTQAPPSQSASLNQFAVFFFKNQIPIQVKSEPDAHSTRAKRMMITGSSIDRDTLLGAQLPAGEISHIKIDDGNQVQVSLIYDVDKHHQARALYTDLNGLLKTEAKENNGCSCGVVTLERCGRYVSLDGHMLAYYATENQVIYIDCQDPEPIFEDLSSKYSFVKTGEKVTKDTFGEFVFYTPLPKYVLQKEYTFVESRETEVEQQRGIQSKCHLPDQNNRAPNQQTISQALEISEINSGPHKSAQSVNSLYRDRDPSKSSFFLFEKADSFGAQEVRQPKSQLSEEEENLGPVQRF